MRQSQQKNRMRGRGRKGPSPLSRTYESNGPDVKIRGTAAHIAEKYASLARDALAAGDTVMGENYLQHSEHYNRIIAAAAAAAQSNRTDENTTNYGRGPQPEVAGFSGGEGEAADAEGRGDNARHDEGEQTAPTQQAQPSEEQPVAANADNGERPPRAEGRNRRRPRQAGASEKANGNGADHGAPNDHDAISANGSDRPARRERGGISSDASMLPDSIVGKSAEPPAGETGAED